MPFPEEIPNLYRSKLYTLDVYGAWLMSDLNTAKKCRTPVEQGGQVLTYSVRKTILEHMKSAREVIWSIRDWEEFPMYLLWFPEISEPINKAEALIAQLQEIIR